MGRGSSGRDDDRVFSIDDSVLHCSDLVATLDSKCPDRHAVVEPAESMLLADYEAALGATRDEWRQAWP